ncbi:MAG: tRNA pseudouridine(38-40) synthase TruA [Planctomycetota bacterium]|nr:tRNA pseudouridine(38-40) synthase TruA [Planctomycetota bacterium]
MSPRNVLITVEYDGTEYHGWQEQPGPRTIQGALQEAVAASLGHAVEIHGASRTDRGVHARGQTASFVTATPVPTERLPVVLNGSLAGDIRVRSARPVREGFLPRFEARGKIYRYSFLTGDSENVFFRRYAAPVRGSLDVPAMRTAAESLVGEHDFASFQSSSKDAPKTTVREIFAARVDVEGPLLHFQVGGSGFLYNMVRTMAGTLLEVGLGRRGPGSLGEVLEARDRRAAGATAEARGLCLIGVYFSLEDLRDDMMTCSILASPGAR